MWPSNLLEVLMLSLRCFIFTIFNRSFAAMMSMVERTRLHLFLINSMVISSITRRSWYGKSIVNDCSFLSETKEFRRRRRWSLFCLRWRGFYYGILLYLLLFKINSEKISNWTKKIIKYACVMLRILLR